MQHQPHRDDAGPLAEHAVAAAPVDNKLARASSQLEPQFLTQAFGAFVEKVARMSAARRARGMPPVRSRQAVAPAMMLHSLSKSLRPASHPNPRFRERETLRNSSRATLNARDAEPLAARLNGNGGGNASKRVVEDEIADRWKRRSKKRARKIPAPRQWTPSLMILAQLGKSVKRRYP